MKFEEEKKAICHLSECVVMVNQKISTSLIPDVDSLVSLSSNIER